MKKIVYLILPLALAGCAGGQFGDLKDWMDENSKSFPISLLFMMPMR